MIEEDGVADDFGRKPVAIVRVGWVLHPLILIQAGAGHKLRCQCLRIQGPQSVSVASNALPFCWASGKVRVGQVLAGDIESEIGQTRVTGRTWPITAPAILAVTLSDRKVIDAGVALLHQTGVVVVPILVSVGTEPVAGVIMPFVGEAQRNAIPCERPKLQWPLPAPADRYRPAHAT
jgi:hypothetical protein